MHSRAVNRRRPRPPSRTPNVFRSIFEEAPSTPLRPARRFSESGVDMRLQAGQHRFHPLPHSSCVNRPGSRVAIAVQVPSSEEIGLLSRGSNPTAVDAPPGARHPSKPSHAGLRLRRMAPQSIRAMFARIQPSVSAPARGDRPSTAVRSASKPTFVKPDRPLSFRHRTLQEVPANPALSPTFRPLPERSGPNEGGRHPGPGHSWRSTNTETPPSGPAPAGRSPVDSLEGRSPPRRLTSKLSAPMLNAAPVCVGFRGFTVPKGADRPGWARATSSGLHDRGEAFPRRCCRVGGLCAEQHVDDSSRGRTTRPRGVKTNRVLSGRERILIVDYKTPTTAGRSTGQEPPDVLSFSVKGNE